MEPQRTTNPTTLLNNLYTTVQSAGPVFTGRATVTPHGEGYRMTIQLQPTAFNQSEVGERVKKSLGSLVRCYMREAGWRVKSASIKKGYVELLTAPRQ